MTKSKPLTPGQLRALKIIQKQAVERGSYHRGQPSMTDRDFIREDVLGRLVHQGFITSAPPFAFSFHTVRLTEKGLRALSHG